MHSETAARIFLKIFMHGLPTPEKCSVKYFLNPNCRLGVVAIFVKRHYIEYVIFVKTHYIQYISIFQCIAVSVLLQVLYEGSAGAVRHCRCSRKSLQVQEEVGSPCSRNSMQFEVLKEVSTGAVKSPCECSKKCCRCSRKSLQVQ